MEVGKHTMTFAGSMPTNNLNPKGTFMKQIPVELYNQLEFLGLIDSSVRSTHVGHSDYSKQLIQPWTIWLAYPALTSWDHDIVKRILRNKSTDPRIMDYQKIIHICQERIRQLNLKEST